MGEEKATQYVTMVRFKQGNKMRISRFFVRQRSHSSAVSNAITPSIWEKTYTHLKCVFGNAAARLLLSMEVPRGALAIFQKSRQGGSERGILTTITFRLFRYRL